LFGGPVVDFIRESAVNDTYSFTFENKTYQLSSSRFIFLIGFIISFFGFLLVCVLYKEIDVERDLEEAN
jgi:hypothetical protein